MPWGDDAFARAAAEEKPILLSISAVWCHWCHVMDETSYSDAGRHRNDQPALRAGARRQRPPSRRQRALQHGRLADDRVPGAGRNDADRRDLSSRRSRCAACSKRSRAFTPSARTRSRQRAAELHARRRAPACVRRGARATRRSPRSSSAARGRTTRSSADSATRRSSRSRRCTSFCSPSGGCAAISDLYEMVARTMLGDGARRHVRSRRGRLLPLLDDARLERSALRKDGRRSRRTAARPRRARDSSRRPTDFRATLVSAVGYVRDVLLRSADGILRGQPGRRRELLRAAARGTTRARGAVRRPNVLHELDVRARRRARASRRERSTTTRCSRERCRRRSTTSTIACSTQTGSSYHVLQPGGAPEVRGLLTDQVAYVRALLDAHETAGEARFLERAHALCDAVIEHFAAEDGGFYDRLPTRGRVGAARAYRSPDRRQRHVRRGLCCASRR